MSTSGFMTAKAIKLKKFIPKNYGDLPFGATTGSTLKYFNRSSTISSFGSNKHGKFCDLVKNSEDCYISFLINFY